MMGKVMALEVVAEMVGTHWLEREALVAVAVLVKMSASNVDVLGTGPVTARLLLVVVVDPLVAFLPVLRMEDLMGVSTVMQTVSDMWTVNVT